MHLWLGRGNIVQVNGRIQVIQERKMRVFICHTAVVSIFLLIIL